MRLDTIAAFSLFLCFAAAHPEPTLHHHHQRSSHLLRRGKQLFRDIGVAFSGLGAPKRQSWEVAPRKVVKRSAVNAQNQCILKVQDSLTTAVSGSSQPTSTSTIQTPAGATTSSKTSTSTSTSTGSSTTATSAFKKKFDSSGSNFFSNWTFFSDTDPTDGTVQYTTQSQAQAANLIEIDSNGYAIMRVDTTPVVTGNRMSVRIESTSTYTGGLWVIDALHMPTGCGTWPAFWTHGPNWPDNGEIDIIEGVNANTFNQVSLHTTAGCSLAANFNASGSMLSSVCAVSASSNDGCSIEDTNPNSYGTGFNSNGGGVYAMLWDTAGISVWFFDRNSIPADLTAQAPQPSSWSIPSAQFPASTCPPFTYNNAHTTIFDTTLCGVWAGTSWTAAPNGGGQSCAAQTGVATCEQYVQNNGSAFAEAYWQVKSVRIYQTSSDS